MSGPEAFNQSGFSKFLNSPAGRIFRLVAGTGFLVVGYVYRDHALGVLSMARLLLHDNDAGLDARHRRRLDLDHA